MVSTSAVVREDAGLNLSVDSCNTYCDIQSCARATHLYCLPRSTQPCIPPGSLNRVPALAGVKAGISSLSGGIWYVSSVVVWQCTVRPAITVYFTSLSVDVRHCDN